MCQNLEKYDLQYLDAIELVLKNLLLETYYIAY